MKKNLISLYVDLISNVLEAIFIILSYVLYVLLILEMMFGYSVTKVKINYNLIPTTLNHILHSSIMPYTVALFQILTEIERLKLTIVQHFFSRSTVFQIFLSVSAQK